MKQNSIQPGPHSIVRNRPHWYARTVEVLLSAAALWHLLEDCMLGHYKTYSGEFFPWRQYFNIGIEAYWFLFALQLTLLCLFMLRRCPGIVPGMIGVLLLLDNMGSFLNHRMLLSFLFVLISFRTSFKFRDKPVIESAVYWNYDLIRIQVSLIYFLTGIHKINSQFLSGQTIHNIIWMSEHHDIKHYPEFVHTIIGNNTLMVGISIAVIITQLCMPIGLNNRKYCGVFLLTGLLLHLSLAVLMPYVKIFSFIVIIALHAFIPDRSKTGQYKVYVENSNIFIPWFVRNFTHRNIRCETVNNYSSLQLEDPDGHHYVGLAAAIELMAQSPITLFLSEILRGCSEVSRKLSLIR